MLIDVINGDLYIAFGNDYNINNAEIISLDNGTEFEVYDGDIASIIFPDFERKLNRGRLHADDLELIDMSVNDDGLLLAVIRFDEQDINVKVDCSQLKNANL